MKITLARVRELFGSDAAEQGGEWAYVAHPERVRRHTRVTALRTGAQAFPEMLAAIRGAQTSVHLETYILRADQTGHEFQSALLERARAGVAVRLLFDALGCYGLPPKFLEPLRASGVEVVVFHPVAPWRPRWGLNQRDHKKILVVDGRVGFTGGLNIADEYRASEEGGGGWFDWHARIDGPAVGDLSTSFRKTWIKAGGARFVDAEPPGPTLGRNALGVQVITNHSLRTRWRMQRAYLHAIHHATASIDIMNAYFIPELLLRRALASAAKRGVTVRVIVPSNSDVKAVMHASRHLYGRLLRQGVRIFEWPERMMHAKFGVIDSTWSTIGSYNFDRRSLMHNLEAGLVVIDHDLGRALAAEFEADVGRCREVMLAEWSSRTRWDRFLDWAWYQMRSWL